jgi:DNA-3-methyladenine glycosylase
VDTPGAVLTRAFEPLEGVDIMIKNGGTREVTNLTSGPGKLTQALRIDRGLNGEDMASSDRLYLTDGRKIDEHSKREGGRIGVSRAMGRQWRFFLVGNPYVSKARPAMTGNANP